MNRRLAFVLLGTAALAGCATTTRTVYDQAPDDTAPVAATDRYEPVPGRGPDVIDPLRAGLAPAHAEVLPGKSPAADLDLLTPQSYVLVGTSRHERDDDAARRWIAEQGAAVGADTIRVYAHADAASPGVLTASYFVRVRLVFGASFRDLNAQERAAFPAGGVRLGDIVGASPASRANLLSGDIITAVDGRPVADRTSFQAQLKEKMGRTVALTVGRNGETIERKVQLGRTFASQ
ncbi:MAG TPA: PDZ domain-containing protein [Tahibacter sp.]|nr:PDZ domain-containing protein [Tahibacter sp.]